MHATTRTHIPLPTRWKLARLDRILRKHTDTMTERFGPEQTARMRTETLAWGCDRCDFRFRTPGETTAPWPPVFAERHCGLIPREESEAPGVPAS